MSVADDNTKMMQNQLLLLGKRLDELQGALTGLPSGDPHAHDVADFADAIFCMRLSLTFYSEANMAVQAGAWFAAAAVASSALEAMLLAKCFLHKDQIKTLPKWRELKSKYQSSFGDFARSMDLGKLLQIAKQLSWFPSGGVPGNFRNVLSTYCDQAAMDRLLTIFKNETDVGQTCASHLHEYRNLIHPAVCLKKRRQPTMEVGISATFVFLVAFSALAGELA